MEKQKIRYAVVGLGHIAQAAMLPAFTHAENSELVALVSGDIVKLKRLAKRYGVQEACTYDRYDELLRSGEVDAVYIALPNHMHHAFSTAAMKHGVHVLCEKPMALNFAQCNHMIRIARNHGVKLMIAYRLHFEESTLNALALAETQLGDPRLFSSTFAIPVREGNIRLMDEKLGGGPLYDIGIYCINAARGLFKSEPVEVFAYGTHSGQTKLRDIRDTIGAVLKFPEGRIATFNCSFATPYVDHYRILGTEGELFVQDGYSYDAEIKHWLTKGGQTQERTFARRDQFGPELVYFSDCILKNREPEPSGAEGLLDIMVIESLFESINTGRPVVLPQIPRKTQPTLKQEIRRPPVEPPELVHVQPPVAEAA